MTMVWNHDHVAQRAEQHEREGAKEMRKFAEAEAISGPSHVDGTDGSEILVADGSGDGESDHAELREDETRDDDNTHTSGVVEAQLAEGDKAADQSMLDVGDTVSPTDRETNTTVMAIPGETAGEHLIEEIDETVAEYSDCDPTEEVYIVTFPKRTTKEIGTLQRYPYPRSRLEVVHRIHDRDGAEGGDE